MIQYWWWRSKGRESRPLYPPFIVYRPSRDRVKKTFFRAPSPSPVPWQGFSWLCRWIVCNVWLKCGLFRRYWGGAYSVAGCGYSNFHFSLFCCSNLVGKIWASGGKWILQSWRLLNAFFTLIKNLFHWSKIRPAGRGCIDKVDKGIFNFLASKIDWGIIGGKKGLNCWA